MRLSTLERGIRNLSVQDFSSFVAGVQRAQLQAELGPVSKLELMLTTRCSMRCAYCWLQQVDRLDMSEATAAKAVDYLFDHCGDLKRVEITLFGGEPLLNLPALKTAVHGDGFPFLNGGSTCDERA